MDKPLMDHLQIEQGIRLRQLIKALKLTQATFAKSLGMTQPNISRMIGGGNTISVKVLNAITEAHKKVNLQWLLTGEGAMFRDEAEQGGQVHEPSARYTVRGKGRLEELEERVERLEAEVARLKAAQGKGDK